MLYKNTEAGDADQNAEHYIHQVIKVSKNTKIDLQLAKGGSAVAYLRHD